jgi:hypothetical protein
MSPGGPMWMAPNGQPLGPRILYPRPPTRDDKNNTTDNDTIPPLPNSNPASERAPSYRYYRSPI